jgi:DNA-binding NtrC family response regulator
MNISVINTQDARFELICSHLKDAGLELHTSSSTEDLLGLVTHGSHSVVIIDLCALGLHDGMELLSRCQGADPRMPVVVISDMNDAAIAVEAMRKGALDFITDARLSRLSLVCRSALQARQVTLQARANEQHRHDAAEGASADAHHAPGKSPIQNVLRGTHPTIAKLRSSLLKLAAVDTDVLVRGETGCGKEVVARCLHDYGPRVNKPFVAINCGAIPENIFESELFGHEAGAFTGAAKRRIGKLEHAAGGTVFLDEIESLPMAMQVKLLRALQQRTVERVGGNQPIRLSCRVVVATKDDLLELAKAGRFRMDLYYRLNVIELALPPLRERREDIALLAQCFSREVAQHHGITSPELPVEFVCRLMAREWPGNVRELRNAVERELLGMPESAGPEEDLPKTLAEQVASFERAVIEQSLRLCQGSVTRVSQALHVPRKTLYDKLAKFSVDPSHFRMDSAEDAGRISYAPVQ